MSSIQDPNGSSLGQPKKGTIQAPNGGSLGDPQRTKFSDGLNHNSGSGRDASGHSGSDASSCVGFGQRGSSNASKLRKGK
jgi:hypothetical protein